MTSTVYDAPTARDVPTILRAGETLRLRRGATYGPLKLQGEGTAGKRVTVGVYGTGPLPVVQGLEVAVPYCTVYDVASVDAAWAGFALTAPYATVARVTADRAAAGVHVAADHCTVRQAVLTDNAKMSVNTKTPTYDDSGAFGVAIYRAAGTVVEDVTVRGSYAPSYDFGYDGSGIELYDATDTTVRRVRSFDNETFCELGGRTRNTLLEDVFAFGTLPGLKGLVTRGAQDQFGPVYGTKLNRAAIALTGAGSAGVVASGGAAPEVLAIADSVIVAETALWTDGPISENPNVRYVGKVVRNVR